MVETGDAWFAAMHRGDLASAWTISDAVLAGRDPAAADDPALPYHRRWVWDGRALDGKPVLVRCYHGLGDTLQFARLLPMLRPRVASITLEAPPALLGLLAALTGVDRLVSFDPAAPMAVPTGTVAVELMELAHVLRLDRADLPGPMPWARPCGTSGDVRRVGLCWQAGGWNPERSLPLRDLARVLPRGLALVSLQRGAAADDAVAPDAPVFVECEERSTDIDRIAALIAGLDLVVSVDTLVAHLAGSLDVPTLLLLKHDADWRWMRDCAEQPWYRSLIRLRQEQPGDWGAPLRELKQRLGDMSSAR